MSRWLLFRWPPWLKRLILVCLFGPTMILVALHLWLASSGPPLLGDPTTYMLQRKGMLSFVHTPLPPTRSGDYRIERVRLQSTSGMAVDLNLMRPEGRKDPMPVMVIAGGHRTGRKAVHLTKDTHGFMIVALNYPYSGPHRLRGHRVFTRLPEIRRGLFDMPPALMLAADYLSGRPDVDGDRMELVGVSLGAQVVCTAGALEPRFSRIWAVQGGGDQLVLLEHNLRSKIPGGIIRYPMAYFGWFMLHGLSAEKWVNQISPRPFVMITARDDQRIPGSCTQLLYATAGHPKEHIVVEGGHIHPKKPETVVPLLDVIYAKTRLEDRHPIAEDRQSQ